MNVQSTSSTVGPLGLSCVLHLLLALYGERDMLCAQSCWPHVCSVDFFHRRAAGAARCAASTAEAAAWHTALRHAAAASCCLVHLHHDRIDDTLKLLLLGFKFVLLGQLVLVQPVQCLLDGFFNFLFVSAFKFVLQLFLVHRLPHCEAIVLQAIFSFDFQPIRLVLGPEFFGFLHHAVDLSL